MAVSPHKQVLHFPMYSGKLSSWQDYLELISNHKPFPLKFRVRIDIIFPELFLKGNYKKILCPCLYSQLITAAEQY